MSTAPSFPPFQVLGHATMNALPALPVFRTLYFLAKNIPYPRSNEFSVTRDNCEEIARLFSERRVEVGNIAHKKATPVKQKYQRDVTALLSQRLELIEKLARKLGLSSITYLISIPQSKPQDTITLYQQRGIRFLSSPALVYTPAHVYAARQEEGKNIDQGEFQNPNNDAHIFYIARELSQVAKFHAWPRALFQAGVSAINLATWAYGKNTSFSPKVQVGATLAASIAVQIPITLFYLYITRYQEKKVDVAAMNSLESNEEAMEFMKFYKDKSRLEDPPYDERLSYIQNWGKKEV